MASIALTLKKWECRKDGTAPVVFAFTTSKGNVYLRTGVFVEPKQFDNRTRHLLGRKLVGADYQLQSKLMSYLDASDKLSQRVDINEIRPTDYRDRVVTMATVQRQDEFVLDRMENYAALKKAKRTRELYQQTAKRIREFSPVADTLMFGDINKDWIAQFDFWMQERGNRANTRSIHLRNLRAVVLDAIDNDVIAKNPFKRFLIPKEETRHRALTIEQIVALRDVKLSGTKEVARDIFFLSMYLIGINVTDLYALTSIINGRIVYRRSKTKKMYSIKVEPEAMAIIERLKGEKKIIKAAEGAGSAHTFDMWINLNLQRIRLTEFLDIDLTLYWARHTWATIAAELDVPKETISRALGHSTGTVTDIYIKYNDNKVDEANRKVIDFILQL